MVILRVQIPLAREIINWKISIIKLATLDSASTGEILEVKNVYKTTSFMMNTRHATETAKNPILVGPTVTGQY